MLPSQICNTPLHEQIVMKSFIGIFTSNQKQLPIDKRENVDESQNYYVKWKEAVTEIYRLYDSV